MSNRDIWWSCKHNGMGNIEVRRSNKCTNMGNIKVLGSSKHTIMASTENFRQRKEDTDVLSRICLNSQGCSSMMKIVSQYIKKWSLGKIVVPVIMFTSYNMWTYRKKDIFQCFIFSFAWNKDCICSRNEWCNKEAFRLRELDLWLKFSNAIQ